ncbi:hypothetical protein [Actinomadura opuntiae]|uniref:hypothetical protein n=1 Tax=Actinomadura sp. OS1-43 TaxID=604315 RepID=UPI00255AA3B6|nr:hypothetical protein [Actinomadura sp. OS1-43]MDL4815477.1 hypothetical protein [Actinomadura sp. OS1-43]
MTGDEMERDLRAAVDERLAARLAEARQQRANRQARALRHHKRRKAGMRARHRAKLARLRDQTTQDPDESHPPHATTPPTDDAA